MTAPRAIPVTRYRVADAGFPGGRGIAPGLVSEMSISSRFSLFGYAVIVSGILMACMSAVVPFYTTGYRLQFGVLVAGITPYLVYGLIIALFRHTLTRVAGVILLLLHVWLVVSERFIGAADYSDGVIYIAPLAFTGLLVPLLVRAIREPWHE